MAERDSAAKRRRDRRLRMHWRHEQLTLRMALAAALHHSRDVGPVTYNALRSQKTARAREEEENEMHFATGQMTPPPRAATAEYYPLTPGAEAGGVLAAGGRPSPLVEVRPQERDLRRTVVQIVDAVPFVQILDDPVPQMVEQLLNLVQFFAVLSPVPEQVIEVPKILPHEVPSRRLCRDTQLAEQLVEVPTIVSWSLLQRIPEQIDDNPVPHGGRGASGGLQGFLPGHSSSKRTANKIADLPAPRSGVGRLQGFLPQQSSTATSSSSPERISERIVEQIAVSRVGESLQDFLPGQGSSSSSHDPARGFESLDQPGYGVFRTFPHFQKSATHPSHSGSELPPHSSSWTPAPSDASMVLEEEEEEEEEEESEDEPVEFVEYVQHDGLWWGCEWDPAHQRHCWWLAAADGSQAGHTIWRPPWLIGSGPG